MQMWGTSQNSKKCPTLPWSTLFCYIKTQVRWNVAACFWQLKVWQLTMWLWREGGRVLSPFLPLPLSHLLGCSVRAINTGYNWNARLVIKKERVPCSLRWMIPPPERVSIQWRSRKRRGKYRRDTRRYGRSAPVLMGQFGEFIRAGHQVCWRGASRRVCVSFFFVAAKWKVLVPLSLLIP